MTLLLWLHAQSYNTSTSMRVKPSCRISLVCTYPGCLNLNLEYLFRTYYLQECGCSVNFEFCHVGLTFKIPQSRDAPLLSMSDVGCWNNIYILMFSVSQPCSSLPSAVKQFQEIICWLQIMQNSLHALMSFYSALLISFIFCLILLFFCFILFIYFYLFICKHT